MTFHIEVSDFNHFPKAFATYCGLITGDDSSGQKNKRLGITKQGNSLIRKTLVECLRVLVRGANWEEGKR